MQHPYLTRSLSFDEYKKNVMRAIPGIKQFKQFWEVPEGLWLWVEDDRFTSTWVEVSPDIYDKYFMGDKIDKEDFFLRVIGWQA